MASLKEVKTRIGSVRITRKITSARQIVASTKLHRAQESLARARATRDGLQALWDELELRLPPEPATPVPRVDDKPLAVVPIASDSGMAGAFNALIKRRITEYKEPVRLHPIGTRIGGIPAAHISLEAVRTLGAQLAGEFTAGEIAGVELLYHDFQSMSRQPVVGERLLPWPDSAPGGREEVSRDKKWIVEPDAGAVARRVAGQLLAARFWVAVVSSRASEQLARMVAMQAATDNADELLDELQLNYNKLRQQNITSELLDIIGSSFA